MLASKDDQTAANADLAARAGIRGVNLAQKRSAADLAGLVDRGGVKPRIGEVFRLQQAREAQDTSQHGWAKGRILLMVERVSTDRLGAQDERWTRERAEYCGRRNQWAQSYGPFSGPDDNSWLFQEITTCGTRVGQADQELVRTGMPGS
jgi:hypothetical protein